MNLSSFKIKEEPIEDGILSHKMQKLKLITILKRLKDLGIEIGPELYLLSEDSGIEINYLNGAPGIKSARYGGDISSRERNELILSKLEGCRK